MTTTKGNKKVFFWHSFVGFFAPLLLFAQEKIELVNPPKDANDLLNRIGTYVINPIIYLLFSAAFVVFVFGIVQFVAHLDNEEARKTGGRHMLYGIIGMVVMVGVNAIIGIIQNLIMQIGSG